MGNGDSLSTIAERSGATLSQLLSWNPALAANPNLIHPGQRIKVRPGKHAAVTPSVTASVARKEPKPREHSRPATRPAATPVRSAVQDDRLARIERELREVKSKLNEVSGKVDKLKPKPEPKPVEKPVEMPRLDSATGAERSETDSVPPAHEPQTEPTPDVPSAKPTSK
ncbi:LysM peptidoglycan-binding domain-containing protein [Streptomyces halobius]|uniref:LysM peptidoglycan-binding domain-containing protein n=1 Tax=Streptomyces halobius TaxID=2879846 RepID=A0ABY4M316_9ACTN|nr:LysM domain-containing protein [Streptomyces halobius]UQA92164.1 LysM peptidoglycan-binding domain-containing protein [Streptomyces halobius]